MIENTKIIPDLLFYIQKYVVNSTANKFKIPFTDTFPKVYIENVALLTTSVGEIFLTHDGKPIYIDDYLRPNKSFIKLLFDESWPIDSTNYTYLYREEPNKCAIPDTLLRRMMVYPDRAKIFVSDSSVESILNIFNLQKDDLDMLHLLLIYRLDTTSCDISEIIYEDLNTNLSKLIYVYLNFKINGDFSIFDNSTLISNEENILENFYESFIIDTIFIHLSSQGT